MIAVDTNVIVRFLMRDEERQWQRAVKLFKDHQVVLMSNVLMEAEWVLRKTFGLDRSAISEAFSRLSGMPNVALESEKTILLALADYRAGTDFADALHLRRSVDLKADAFVTFDKALRAKAAKLVDGLVVREP